jgi:hypothetical protein
MRTEQAAAYTQLSASTLEKMRVAGGGPVYHLAGRKIVLYNRRDLDHWLSARRRTSTSDPGPVGEGS